MHHPKVVEDRRITAEGGAALIAMSLLAKSLQDLLPEVLICIVTVEEFLGANVFCAEGAGEQLGLMVTVGRFTEAAPKPGHSAGNTQT